MPAFRLEARPASSPYASALFAAGEGGNKKTCPKRDRSNLLYHPHAFTCEKSAHRAFAYRHTRPLDYGRGSRRTLLAHGAFVSPSAVHSSGCMSPWFHHPRLSVHSASRLLFCVIGFTM